MRILRRSDEPEGPMDAEHFSGAVVRRDHGPIEGLDATALRVRFPAGARTHWHSHPHGQILVVTHGSGRVGTRDGHVERLEEGDVVHAPAGEEHWHGAAQDASVEHLALSFGDTAWQEAVED